VADPRRLLLAALLSVVLLPGAASGATRTYSTGPLDYPIPDVGRLEVPLRVLQKGPVSYLEVWLHVDHSRDSDLTLSLVAPTGSAVVLSAKRGGTGRNYGGGDGRCGGFFSTMFSDDGNLSIARGKPPFRFDVFTPEQPLALLYGIEAAGTWKLRLDDDRPGATGAVRCFQLILSRKVVETQTAQARGTTARLSYVEWNGAYTSLRLQIVRGGRVAFDARPRMLSPCVCAYNGPTVSEPGGAVHVRDLDGDREPEVLVGLYTGGVHCCWYTDVYRYVRRSRSYRPTIGFWGNLLARLVDLDGDGRPEFRTGDDRFAYVFTSFAASAFPLRIFRFDHGRFLDVTRRFPRLVRRDAAKLYALYREERRGRPDPAVAGILPAWLADQYLLGRGPSGWVVLRRAVRRGEIRSFDSPRTYLRKVRFFLRHTGYIRP
jgi:subtilisin-like proprotein convertase family protein